MFLYKEPWSTVIYVLNAFHNNKKKITLDHSVKYRRTYTINNEDYILCSKKRLPQAMMKVVNITQVMIKLQFKLPQALISCCI